MSHFKKPTTIPELRQRVYTCIDKLSDRATLSQALSELQLLTQTLSSDFIHCFLSCILSLDSSSKSSVKVHCINLIPLLVKTHQDLIFPHITKIIIPSFLRRIRDGDSSVRTAIAGAMGSISFMGLNAILGPFLGAVMTEQEGNAQIGSCVSLKAAIDSATVVEGGDEAELRRVLPKLMKIVRSDGFKAKGALMGLIGSIVGVNNGGLVNGRVGLVGNVVSCAVEMLSCEDWGARKGAAEVLQVVANVGEEQSVMEVKRFVVSSLESRRFDKVKITRETMNRALAAWKDVPGGPEEELFLSRSNSSFSKDNGSTGSSPPVSRRSSFACFEAPKPKKTMTKTRSSLSDGLVASISSSTEDVIGLETPQRKKTLSKSRSLLSDFSTITDSSSLSKSSCDGRFETPLPKKPTTKSRSSLPDDLAATVTKKTTAVNDNDGKFSASQTTDCKKAVDWKVEVVAEKELQSECEIVEVTSTETRDNFFKKTSEEMRLKIRGIKSSSRVVPFVEEAKSQGLVVGGGLNEEVGENNTDVEELSLIRSQLLQIERQQSNLMHMLQRLMGNSQNGIDSLETRVTGLERALDEISYDLAVQSGRIPHNDAPASTCCPSTEFLSPKFWRRTEGRSSMSKSSCPVSLPNKDSTFEVSQMDGHRHRLPKQQEGICRDEIGSFEVNSAKSVKSIGQNNQRGRTCSPRSFDGASTAPFIAPVIRGA